MSSAGTGPPAGWHPDPGSPQGSLRWWDGAQWTAQTQPLPIGMPAATIPPSPVHPHHSYPSAPMSAAGSGMSGSLVKQNQLAMITMAVTVVYIVVALTAHIVFLGIAPVLMCVRSFQRREPLAPLAAVAAAVAVGTAVVFLR